jgi:hypothetical protein
MPPDMALWSQVEMTVLPLNPALGPWLPPSHPAMTYRGSTLRLEFHLISLSPRHLADLQGLNYVKLQARRAGEEGWVGWYPGSRYARASRPQQPTDKNMCDKPTIIRWLVTRRLCLNQEREGFVHVACFVWKKKKKKKKKNMVLGFVSYFGVVRSAFLAATPTTTIATGMYYQGQQTTEYYLWPGLEPPCSMSSETMR